MTMKDVKIEKKWKSELIKEFEKPYWKKLTEFVRKEYLLGKVYPPPKNIFRAFDLCPFDKVKVVIVGQDPYHGEAQANGLSFAVSGGISIPPSLQNIYKEIKNDLGIEPIQSGDLSRWANQGVLMLNSVLTVSANQPASHKNRGWEEFTDGVIQKLNENRKNIVYMLWGNYAKQKGLMVDADNNLILTSAHPSPFSAQAFFGSKHFSLCNLYLTSHGMSPIDWK
ncbi:MAG: uracil-DNA glycosylase [Candidatus Roizmanbacteria bacterium]|nr:uracil-DNA glycosylase [Candidatus Roizmanbacteria bacterium]